MTAPTPLETADDGLDMDYPGLCGDCAGRLSNLLKTVTAETEADFLAVTAAVLCVHKRALLSIPVDTDCPF